MFLLDRILQASVRKGELTVIDPSGRRKTYGGKAPLDQDDEPFKPVTMRVSDSSLSRRLAFNPDLHAGEAYMNGGISFEEGSNLRDFMMLYSVNQSFLDRMPMQKALDGARFLLRRFQQANPLGRARKHIAHHYDLGNEFYKLFLDDSMTYSCAYFADPEESLESAQRNKLRLLAAKLGLKPGLRILDIGSGWGDLGLYLAGIEDVEVVGVTLSDEQHELSNEKARKLGLQDRVRFDLLDYRLVEGSFDRIVSVGMFEHIGVGQYDVFFGKVRDLLPPDGLAVLHSIARMAPPGIASTWYHKYIFPGGYIPALSEVFPYIEGNGLWCTDMEFLRLHYAYTLRHWSKRFEKNREKIVEMYDERFARMWEFYLYSAEMVFRTGTQMVFQAQLSPSRAGAPITRDYVTDLQRVYREKEKSFGKPSS